MSKTILVVEDEPDLLDLIHELLVMEGYTVLNAESASVAEEIWRKNSNNIDLLLTDITLPGGITGLTLAGKLNTENPALKVVYTSGYTVEMVSRQNPLPPGANFLQKPFHPSALAQTVLNSLNS